ncbi:DNA-directed RNA polymerase I subunit RPA1-like isoform X3 [Dreissena polymorpha]|uniref:DNA-directed RNA polymerase I subunit RPA1-like isoform X3 n=1 Tax=Dreissena polymorpha TaxID=45954 RepID=UPI00226526C2|nr:DNA-directed RNA polymerase I subunit RPA1-like isoform X3 [Dreissena polymorpha]
MVIYFRIERNNASSKMDHEMSNDYNPNFMIQDLQFRFYTTQEIKALSVKEITNTETFDNLNHPTVGGLYDSSLGPTEDRDVCSTCTQSFLHCPGHMGHIELALPVYNPLLFTTLYQTLKATCFNCHRLVVDPIPSALFLSQCRLLDASLLAEAAMLGERYEDEEKSEDRKNHKEEILALTEEILKFHSQHKKDLGPDETGIKNILALRQHIHKQLIKVRFKRSGKCVHCSTKLKSLRQEDHSKIYLVGRLSKLNKSDETTFSGSNNKDDDEDEDDAGENSDSNYGPVRKKQKTGRAKSVIKLAGGNVTLLTALKVRSHLRSVYQADKDVLCEAYPVLKSTACEFPTDIFFLEAVAVPPTKFRPISEMRDQKYEHPQTSNLIAIVRENSLVSDILWETEKVSADKVVDPGSFSRELNAVPGKTLFEKLSHAQTRLQMSVNQFMDSESDKSSLETKASGIKQLLEKKEGLFRKNMMGKRVNFAARSVISPDPNINTNEIGIPMVFAKVLTYPQPVTPWNVHELRQAVINGPDKYPGATHVVEENGRVTRLLPHKAIQREALANSLLTPSEQDISKPITGTKKVLRHLKNGDVLLINRQPTLHRPSIQAHKARVLTGEKTLRLHYSNCKAYNADFDGDEMNAHFPQNEIARAEAYNLVCTDFQYLVPKDGTPLAGLIQDHMVSGVALTIRGRFFDRQDYCRLVYGALVDKPGRLKLLAPSIVRPRRLWSGKQVLSTVILNIIPPDRPALSLTGKSKIPAKIWVKTPVNMPEIFQYGMCESDVVIRHGELLCGVLDKGHYGPTPFGLVHCCYELYGGAVAGQVLTCFGRLFMNFLQLRGFTLGVKDILVTKQADKKRSKIVKHSPLVGESVARKTLGIDDEADIGKVFTGLMKAHHAPDQQHMRELDMNMRGHTNDIQNDIVNTCMGRGLLKQFPDNNLQLMVQSGAKGSMVNCMQISCLLGQIELEGKRPPLMLSGRTLPSFMPYDMTPRAGGFVTGRFLTGIRPQEYFFHCMAGREGLIDTAVKTSRSGYLQRCLIKHLEGIKVNYDLTVRDSDNSIIQFYYGEDGLDLHKTGFLGPQQFPLLVENHKIVVSTTDRPGEVDEEQESRINRLVTQIHKWRKKHGYSDPGKKIRTSGFLTFCQNIEVDRHGSAKTMPGRLERDAQLTNMWRKLNKKKQHKYSKNQGRCPDPLMSQFTPYQPGVLPEKVDSDIKKFARVHLPRMHMSEESFLEMIHQKLRRAVVEPGEPVGLLSAQSIGEPSTQMTLNTFHFAGRGEMNVTLGIPRLREVLMVGSKQIKTPAMDVPVYPGKGLKAKQLQKHLTRVHLNELLQDVKVVEWMAIKDMMRSQRRRMFRVTFTFLPHVCYKDKYVVTPDRVLTFVEKVYYKKLLQLIRKRINTQAKQRFLSTGQTKKRGGHSEKEDADETIPEDNMKDDDDDDEDVDADDGDDTTAGQKRKKEEEQEYEDLEDETGGDNEGLLDEQAIDDEEIEMDEEAGPNDVEGIDEALIEEYEAQDAKNENLDYRINAVLQVGPEVTEYKFDTKKKLWAEITLSYPLVDTKIDLLAVIEKHVQEVVVHEVAGISRCMMGEEKAADGLEMHLKTEGINMMEMYKYREIVDINRLYCNSIHHVAETYGIEAANKAIIKEISAVFAAYGIDVDYHHLSLIADYMTFEGVYKPFNRRALESNPSALQKMSFESTMTFVLSATVNNSLDTLKTPSSQIVVGKHVTTGTGCFDLFTPLVIS